jgi:hypothetical protein
MLNGARGPSSAVVYDARLARRWYRYRWRAYAGVRAARLAMNWDLHGRRGQDVVYGPDVL